MDDGIKLLLNVSVQDLGIIKLFADLDVGLTDPIFAGSNDSKYSGHSWFSIFIILFSFAVFRLLANSCQLVSLYKAW